MTKDDLYFYVSAKKELEFKFNGVTYCLNYDKTPDGKEVIIFGPIYEGKKYSSYGELVNNAKVENHFFREMLEDL